MCGIAGYVNYTSIKPQGEIIQRMMEVLRHRGPDGQGIYTDDTVGLGHVRLSIIDVEGSKQPLSNEDDTVWITFNGEIYNYKELRKLLLTRGHVFCTNGDTEVLVHLYEEYGEEMLERLNGMYAFAIWDSRKQHLFLARDRMGIKPLYYCHDGENFIFASEPKAILQFPGLEANPSIEGIWHYLTFRSVPAPGTLFKGIDKLLPGHWMAVSKEGCTTKRYWDIPLVSCNKYLRKRTRSSQEIVAETEDILSRSVQRRLISDVPLGSFLSGGVDSSLIVALMSKLTNAPVRTYSVGFKNFASSEVSYAKAVADLYKTDHHELILEEDRFAEHLEKLTWYRDSPLSEPADVPLHLLAKEARKDVKVLLSGEGSDELFAGYPKYAYDRFANYVNWLPKTIMRSVSEMMPARMRRIEVAVRSYSEKRTADRWSQWFSPFSCEEKIQLIGSADAFVNPIEQYIHEGNGFSSLDMMLYADCKIWLPDNLLDRGDRMTMATSVEGRVPFLDHELVEHAFGLPQNVKIRGVDRKWVVKQVALKHLPDSIVNRRKVGFAVPLAQWFRGRLRELCYDRICENNGLAKQLLDKKSLYRILDDHCSNRKDNAIKIWTLLGLSVWYDSFRGCFRGR